MTTHAAPAPTSCSMQHQAARIPAVGTAARAVAWVAVQQNGPWGAKAPTQSHLDPEVGAALEAALTDQGARLALIRNPANHADVGGGQRQVFIAGGLEHHAWLVSGTITDPSVLLDIDWSVLRADSPQPVLDVLPAFEPATEPVLLVCTNGKRDVCCAVRGRPVALAAAAQRPGLVWETNHTGGHRFAPTGVMLPWGLTLARLDEPLAVLAVDAAQRGEIAALLLDDHHNRGFSGLRPAEQAAEHFIRQLLGELRLTAFHTTTRPDGLIEVTRNGGHTWVLAVEERGGWPDLPASCGKAEVPVSDWYVTVVPQNPAHSG